MFYLWLRMKGIHSHLDSIVEAIAEKVSGTIIFLSFLLTHSLILQMNFQK